MESTPLHDIDGSRFAATWTIGVPTKPGFTRGGKVKHIVGSVLGIVLSGVFLSAPGIVEATMSGLLIASPAFGPNATIPSKFTCDGPDLSPPLRFENIPEQTRSLALIVDDPDAPRGTWVHWVVWNIPPGTRELPENGLPGGALQGTNDFRTRKYGGPCPPAGKHRYFFKLYALDTILSLNPGSTKGQLEEAMKGHILDQAELVGLYERR